MLVANVRMQCWMRSGLALVLALAAVSPARSDPQPLTDVEQLRINDAIKRGVEFLNDHQSRLGTWATDEAHKVGYAALPGLTLFECGVPRTDPCIQKAAKFVRANSADLKNTYDLALSILFLDRVGDPKDHQLIQTLVLRLIAGQTNTGGWHYECPVLGGEVHRLLLATLQKLSKQKPEPGKPKPHVLAGVPDALKLLPVWHGLNPGGLAMIDPPGKLTDNSNTQFALLAMWAARRHGVPVERTLSLLAHRFRSSQNEGGGWGYQYKEGGGQPESPPMVCCGLLGLALGHGIQHDADIKEMRTFAGGASQAAGAVGFPALLSLIVAVESVQKITVAVEEAQKRARDPKISNGLGALAKHVGVPAGRMENLPQLSHYFLWSLERAGVLYDLPEIGGKDWYRWGAEVLVANQVADGSWDNRVGKDALYPGASPTIDTCLALLFLKRANLAKDLSGKIAFRASQPTIAKAPESPPQPPPNAVLPSIPNLPETFPPQVAEAAPPSVNTTPEPAKSASSPPAETPAEGSGKKPWVLILIIGAAVLLVGGGVLVAVYAFSGGSDEEERPRRAKHKNRPDKKGPRSKIKKKVRD